MGDPGSFTKQVVIESELISLWHYPTAKLLHHQMHRYPGVKVLEDTLTQGLELIRTQGATKWLSDDRAGGAVPKSHHDWGATVWGPRAARAGWRHWALVPPRELLGRANMERLTKTYADLGVQVRVFSSPDEAFTWLVSV